MLSAATANAQVCFQLNIVILRYVPFTERAIVLFSVKYLRVACISSQFKVNEIPKRQNTKSVEFIQFHQHKRTHLIESNQMIQLQNEIYRSICCFDEVQTHLGAINFSFFFFLFKKNEDFDVYQSRAQLRNNHFSTFKIYINEVCICVSIFPKSDTHLFITILHFFFRLSFHSISINKT